MTMNKDSFEVAKFMRFVGKLKDWSDDDPESLPDLASADVPRDALLWPLKLVQDSLDYVRQYATEEINPI
jgi:hypothetical protein